MKAVAPELVAGGATRSMPRRSVAYASLKRSFDVMFAVGILILTLPILLLAILAIRLDSPGPALYRQPRMGRDGRLFNLLKLRGMYVDARERFPELYDYQQVASGTTNAYFFHSHEDPRVTRVGRFLRKYSIDELPNFWNVVRGDMSVVGPRPEIPELAHLYGPYLNQLLSVRPGVTSPAKATRRDELSFDDTLVMELEYIDGQSFRLDFLTIMQTGKAALVGTNVR